MKETAETTSMVNVRLDVSIYERVNTGFNELHNVLAAKERE